MTLLSTLEQYAICWKSAVGPTWPPMYQLNCYTRTQLCFSTAHFHLNFVISLLLCYRCCWYRSITFLTITIIFLRQVRKLTSTITIFVWHKPSKSTRISCLGNIVRTVIWRGWSRIPFVHLLRSQLRLIYQHFFRGHNAYATQSVMFTILYYDWFNRGASFADAYRHIVNSIITISLQVQSMIYHLVYSHMNDFLGIIIARTSISVRLTCTLWKLLRLLSQRHCTIELYLDFHANHYYVHRRHRLISFARLYLFCLPAFVDACPSAYLWAPFFEWTKHFETIKGTCRNFNATAFNTRLK